MECEREDGVKGDSEIFGLHPLLRLSWKLNERMIFSVLRV